MRNRFEIRGNVAVVFIDYRGETFEVLLDVEDLPRVQAHTWRLNKGRSTPYAVSGGLKKVWMHKLVMNVDRGPKVDHANFSGLDNRKANLSVVDYSLNARRTKNYSTNTSGHRGVSFNAATNKWRAYVRIDGVQKHLGWFDHQGDAVIAAADEMERLNAVVEPPSAEEYERAAEAQAIARRMGEQAG